MTRTWSTADVRSCNGVCNYLALEIFIACCFFGFTFSHRGGGGGGRGGVGGITGTPGPPLATPPEFKKVTSEDVKFVLSSFACSSANSEWKGCLV